MFENIKEAIITIKGKKVRYCETAASQLMPCNVGWGQMGNDGFKDCFDEPKEENCRYLIDVRDVRCPYCGNHLGQ